MERIRPRSLIGTYGPVLLIATTVVALAGASWFFVSDPLALAVLWVGTLPAAGAAVIIARRSAATAQRERRLRSGIESDRLLFEEEQQAWATRQADEQNRLETIESRLIDQAAAIAWAPRPIEPIVQAEALQRDASVDQLIAATTDRVYEALREGKYVRNDRFEGSLFWADVGQLVREVAAVYRAGGDRAWLEIDARQLALATHRAALRISLRLEQLPTAPSSRKLADIVKWTETYRSGQSLLEYAKPLMDYVPWLYRLVRVLAGAHPASLGLSVVVFELVKKAGFHVSVEVMERYFKSLVHDFVTAIGQEAANVYGAGYGRRSKAWVLGVEAVILARSAPESRAMLSAVIRLLDELDLRDEVDRRALVRALVAPTFTPERADWLAIEDRTEILEKVEALFEAHPTALEASALEKWKTDLEARLGHRSRLDVQSTVHDQAQLESIAHALAAWAQRREVPQEATVAYLSESRTLAELEQADRISLAQTVGATPPNPDRSLLLPRFDLTEARRKAFVEDLIKMMVTLRPWGPEPDLPLIDEVARRFRLDAKKLRARLGAGYVATFGAALDRPSPLKKLPPGAAFAALVVLEPGEDWDFAEDGKNLALPDASKEGKASLRDLQRTLGRGRWLLVSRLRAILLLKQTPQDLSADAQIVWEGRFEDPSVRVERPKRWGRPLVRGGRWTLPDADLPTSGLALEIGRASADRLARRLEEMGAPPS